LLACLLAAASVSAGESGLALGEMQVVSTRPIHNRLRVGPSTPVTVRFDRPVQPATVNSSSFRVYGRWSGRADGVLSFSSGNQTVTLDPDHDFSAGETVYVNLGHSIVAADGSPLRSAGYAFQFTVSTQSVGTIPPGPLPFTQIGTLVVRSTPSVPTRAYGGLGSDFDRDGWLDLGIVNEISEDVRVFKNKADGSGLYEPFLQPPTPVGTQASPNEPADFNNDGLPDAAIANIQDSTVSILLGHGDGTFEPQQVRAVGAQPRGLAVLDVDGDGDPDIATANTDGNNISLLINNGNGVFGPATSFDAGGDGEYSLGAGDMNNDGIDDLVVGTRNDQTIHVLRGNGNGTFTHVGSSPCGRIHLAARPRRREPRPQAGRRDGQRLQRQRRHPQGERRRHTWSAHGDDGVWLDRGQRPRRPRRRRRPGLDPVLLRQFEVVRLQEQRLRSHDQRAVVPRAPGRVMLRVPRLRQRPRSGPGAGGRGRRRRALDAETTATTPDVGRGRRGTAAALGPRARAR
jgi:hypothetical protein